MFDNNGYEPEFGKAKIKEFQPCHVLYFDELGFSFVGDDHRSSTPIGNGGLRPCKIGILGRS